MCVATGSARSRQSALRHNRHDGRSQPALGAATQALRAAAAARYLGGWDHDDGKLMMW